jgi:hypothetical protein
MSPNYGILAGGALVTFTGERLSAFPALGAYFNLSTSNISLYGFAVDSTRFENLNSTSFSRVQCYFFILPDNAALLVKSDFYRPRLMQSHLILCLSAELGNISIGILTPENPKKNHVATLHTNEVMVVLKIKQLYWPPTCFMLVGRPRHYLRCNL